DRKRKMENLIHHPAQSSSPASGPPDIHRSCRTRSFCQFLEISPRCQAFLAVYGRDLLPHREQVLSAPACKILCQPVSPAAFHASAGVIQQTPQPHAGEDLLQAVSLIHLLKKKALEVIIPVHICKKAGGYISGPENIVRLLLRIQNIIDLLQDLSVSCQEPDPFNLLFCRILVYEPAVSYCEYASVKISIFIEISIFLLF